MTDWQIFSCILVLDKTLLVAKNSRCHYRVGLDQINFCFMSFDSLQIIDTYKPINSRIKTNEMCIGFESSIFFFNILYLLLFKILILHFV